MFPSADAANDSFPVPEMWFDHVNDAIVFADADELIRQWNRAAEQLYGWTRAEVLGRPIRKILAVERYLVERYQPQEPDLSPTQLLRRDGLWRGVFLQRTRDGHEVVIEGSLRTIFDQQGAVTGYITINRDITARYQSEAALKASEERFQAIIENGMEGVVVLNPAQEVRYVSPTVQTILGYTSGAFIQLRSRGLVHPDDAALLQQFLTTVTAQPGAYAEVTVRFRHQDGRWRWIEQRGINRCGDPAINGFVVNFRDVTERVEAQHALQQELVARERAEQALLAEHARVLQLKNEFMATISHELRTPLTTILNYAELLLDGIYGELSSRQAGAIETMTQSSNHLLALINDILDYTTFESGRRTLKIKPLLLEPLCQRCVEMVVPSALARQIDVIVELDSAVTWLAADQQRLQQILINLLSNAVKFTPAGGTIGLRVQGVVQEQAVIFEVWDMGIGISEQDLRNLFQPFLQVDARLNRMYEGTGLGLALVRQLVSAHDGSITVTSTLGQGSTFRVSLPWVAVPAPAMESEPIAAPAALPPVLPVAQPVAPLILLAEDNELNIEVMRDALTSEGYRLLVARDGHEALQQARKERPALILMDIRLPGMNGIEVMRALRADSSFAVVPIIALTALAMPGDREQCLAAGADEYLSKPVSIPVLFATIADQLVRSRTEH